MANRMESGTAWLARRLKASASTAVTYRRGAASCTLQASFGRRETIVEATGIVAEHEQWDFVIAAAELVLEGIVELPRTGDRIEAAGRMYEVLPLPGQECFRPCDPFGEQLRIHAKQIQG